MSFRSRNDAAGGEEFEGAGAGAGEESARQTLSTATASEDAEGSARMSEGCIFGSDAQVAGESQVEAAAEAVATNRGDDGLWGPFNMRHQLLTEEREVVGGERSQCSELADIRAGGEGFVGSGDYDTRDG